jgi:hypothetical protein
MCAALNYLLSFYPFIFVRFAEMPYARNWEFLELGKGGGVVEEVCGWGFQVLDYFFQRVALPSSEF